MGFWSNLLGTPNHEGVTANDNPSSTPASVGAGDYSPGDPDGLVFEGEETFSRALPVPMASPWDGWPADWSTPTWGAGRLQKLVDTARDCIDLNASVLSAMPVYRVQSDNVMGSLSWMSNPDPAIYSDWTEFAKQLFWDFQLGEAFVMPSDFFANAKPSRFRVIPPWMVTVDMVPGGRSYKIGSVDVTADILHIRYNSTTDQPRGSGPLEGAGARMVAAEVLSQYAAELAQTGGVTKEWLESDQPINKPQSDELLEQWLESKKRTMGLAGVFGRGAQLKQAKSISAKDMALLELAQFTEARIAVKLGVPPFLVGLPSGGDSMTYSNVSSLFDFHHRASLNPKTVRVMKALSFWALPRGQRVELNRDEYTRPPFTERASAYKALAETGATLGEHVIEAKEIRMMERLQGQESDSGTLAADALTGGDEL